MKKLYCAFFIFVFAVISVRSFSQKLTNKGKEFWVAYGHHQFMEAGYDNSQNMTLYLATGDTAAVVTVQLDSSGNSLPPPSGGPWTRTYTIPANTVIAIDDPMPAGVTITKSPSCIQAIGPIPKGSTTDCGFDARLIMPAPPSGSGSEQVFTKRGIHITATAPIVAYAHIFGSAASGATMLLPTSTWGYNYTSVNSRQANADQSFSWMFVIADHDNTVVEITPSAPTRLGRPAGVPFTVTLQKGHIYQLIGALTSATSGYELTGTTVRSISNTSGESYPVAVFSGSSRTEGELPCNQGGRDNDIQQCFPEESWGKHYLTAPMSVSTSASTLMTNVYKIVVIDPTTVVRRNGVILTGLSNNRYYKYTSNTADYIDADKPIMVAQYMGGDGGTCNPGMGDPEMVYLSPVEQSINNTRFYRNTKENISINYVTLIIPTAGLISLTIDGILFNMLPSTSKFSYPHPVLPGYSVAVRKWTAAKAQCFIQSDSAFTGITYGEGSVESYGYNIGAYYDTLNPHSLRYNTIEGSLFLDANSNAVKDPSEPYFNLAKINTIRAGVDTFETIAWSGEYYIYTDTGSYITSVKPYSPYYNAVPVSRSTYNATYGNHDTADFAMQPLAAKRDLSVVMIPLTSLRPGFPATYKVMYVNVGTDTANGTVEVIKSSKLSYQSSSEAPSSINGDTLRWNFSGLKPLDTAGIYINYMVQAPPSVNIGDTLRSDAKILSDKADLTSNDNRSVSAQQVRGSYDPNDKTEGHGGIIRTSEVANGDYLEYTIRYQNTGTDTAINVYIKDTLDDKLDWNTLRMVATSHDFQMTINEGKNCVWAFSNIRLVDSNRNEPMSHGYISYIIKPKANVAAGNIISNRASIYFDANLAVLTNTENTTVQSSLLPVKLISFTAKKEGLKNVLQWTTGSEINFRNFDIERSNNSSEYASIGKMNAGNLPYQFIDDKPEKTINYYRLKMIDADGKLQYSPVRTVDNSGSFYVSLHPNPVKETLQMQIESDRKNQLQIQIAGMDGTIVKGLSFTAQQGLSSKAISVSALAKGHYLLQVSSGKEQSVIKFEKL